MIAGQGSVSGKAATTSVAFRVFVGYATRDEQFVRPIVAALRERNLEPWVDYEQIDPTGAGAIARIREILESVPAAVFIFGADGAGPWQSREFQFMQNRVVNGLMRGVNVVLPSGKVPPELDLTIGRAIDVTDPEDADTLDRLEWAITGVKPPPPDRGDFEIHIVVPSAGYGCFIAASHGGTDEVYDAIQLAAADVGLTVAQPLHQDEAIYTPDVARAILTSMLVVADCSRDPSTDLIHPQVSYQLGLAKAWGKPGILVSSGHVEATSIYAFSAADIVEFHNADADWQLRLRRELCESMRRVLQGLRHPHLVRPNLDDIHVTYSEPFRHRTVLWRPLHEILRYGLDVYDAFRAIEKHVHAMHRNVEAVARDLRNLEVRDFSRDWNAFCTEYDVFRTEEQKHPSLSSLWRPDSVRSDPSNSDIVGAFEFLRKRLKGTVRNSVEKSRRAHDAAVRDMVEYVEINQNLISLVEKHRADLTSCCHKLRMWCEALAHHVDDVHQHLGEMMLSLLRIVGAEPVSGGTKHGYQV